MDCAEARERWHRRLDEGGTDTALDDHLTECADCRTYVSQMTELVGALGQLREVTEAVRSRRTGDDRYRRAPSRRAWSARAVTGVAAAVVILMGASMLVRNRPWTPRPDDGRLAESGTAYPLDADTAEPSVLGVTLRGESAKQYMAVAVPTSQADVQLYRLYPVLGGDDGSDGS